MKQDYIEQLESSMRHHHVLDADIDDVLTDYRGLYDDALDRGMSDEEIVQLLGNPDDVVKELLDTLQVRNFNEVRRKNNKLVALSPFLAVITFMLLGFLGDMWHPGWLVFLFIPMIGILGNVNKKEKFVALSPFFAVIIFIFLGMAYNLWHPSWLVFIIVPIAGILTGTKRKDILISVMPFLAFIAFILLGTYLDAWLWSWLFFILIPLVSTFYSKKTLDKLLLVPSLLMAVGFYLFMYLRYDKPDIGLIGFALPVVIAIILGKIKFAISEIPLNFKTVTHAIIFVCCLAAFLVVGIRVDDAWGWAWMILLLFPITSILISRKNVRLTTLMPFISVIIFFSIGYFFELWYISWMAFLLIPMVSILENNHDE